jgi:hypothetical protein
MATNRHKIRTLNIVLNGIRSTLSPFLSFLLSYIIIQNYSKGFWGEFVGYLLFFYVINLILNWGGKEYLLRQFSQSPAKMTSNWQAYFVARLPLLGIALLFTAFVYSWVEFQFLVLWILASFVAQSVVPIYLYRRDYLKVILTEIVSFGVLIVLISINPITKVPFATYYGIYCLVKALFYVAVYHPYFKFKSVKFKPILLWVSFPFLAMALTGFFQAKIDLYVFAIFHKKALLAEYQIMSGFLIFSQAIAAIIVLPYVKNVYRMRHEGIAKLNKVIGLIGFLINALVLSFILVLLHFGFSISLSLVQILIAYVIGFPSYFYAVRVFYLFSIHKENKVLLVSLWSLLVNLTLSVILLAFGWSITGVLMANACGQLVCLVLYSQYKINDQTA